MQFNKFTYRVLCVVFLFTINSLPGTLRASHPLHEAQPFPTAEEFQLVEVAKENPKIFVEMKYTTTDNSLGKAISAETKCLVSRRVMDKLNKVQAELERQGFGLKVIDGFRPLYVEVALLRHEGDRKKILLRHMYQKPVNFQSDKCSFDEFCQEIGLIKPEIKQDEESSKKLLAVPLSARGGRVAVTLVTLDGKELEMPCKFGFFGDGSTTYYNKLSPEVIAHRDILCAAMLRSGFGYAGVWYEYHDVGSSGVGEEYPMYLYAWYTTADALSPEQAYDHWKISTSLIERLLADIQVLNSELSSYKSCHHDWPDYPYWNYR